MRLGWKGLPGTSTPTYHENSKITDLKNFYTISPRLENYRPEKLYSAGLCKVMIHVGRGSAKSCFAPVFNFKIGRFATKRVNCIAYKTATPRVGHG